jgi:hypothetical protein
MSRPKRMLEDLDEDIREHIERETQDNIERGMPAEEARYAAVRKFGNITRVKEERRARFGLFPGSKSCCRMFATVCARCAGIRASPPSPF